jgi:hypothetical protein
VYVIIDNPAKRIILIIGKYWNFADKEKEGSRRLTFLLDKSLKRSKIANLIFSGQYHAVLQAALQDEITWKKIT